MAGGGRRSGRIFILLALVLVVILAVAAFLMRDQLFGTQPTAQQPTNQQPLPTQVSVAPTKQIWVLVQDVTLGKVIKKEMIRAVNLPVESNLDESSFFPVVLKPDTEEPDDTRPPFGYFAKYPLKAGLPLTTAMVGDKAPGSIAANQIPPGFVAIPIPISRLTSVAYALEPGDHVSIITSMLLVDIDPNFQTRLPNYIASVAHATGEGTNPNDIVLKFDGTNPFGRAELDPVLNAAFYAYPSETQRPRLVTQTLVQDATVLWVGRFPEAGTPLEVGKSNTAVPVAATPEGATATPAATDPDIITLIVSPQDAVSLNFLMLSGAKLNLALRSAGDTQKVQTDAVTLQFIMDQYLIPFPSKLPYGMEPAVKELKYPDSKPTVVATPGP